MSRRRKSAGEQLDAPDNDAPRVRALAFHAVPGKLGTAVVYLDLPSDVVDRYAVHREAPELKSVVAGRVLDFVGRL